MTSNLSSAQDPSVMAQLVEAVRSASKVNRSLMVPPSAILWTDSERQWSDALPALRELLPELLAYGPFQPDARQGPSIWLKCAVAGEFQSYEPAGHIPVVYLPGISRADLRAIESCPRDLQPLAELQYRGAFWSQSNSKDWTVNAFLNSKNGGLGLDVSQDKATQEALIQSVGAGVLLSQPLEILQGRQINAEWLHNVMAPNAVSLRQICMN